MACASSTKGRTAGFFHKVLLARSRGITGNGPIRRTGSISPLTWLATSTSGRPPGMRSAPTTSTSRKKILRRKRTKARRNRSAGVMRRRTPGRQSPHHPGPLLPASLPPTGRRGRTAPREDPSSSPLSPGGRGGGWERGGWGSEGPALRLRVPPLLVDEGHADQAGDEEDGRREDGRPLRAGGGGDEAEDEGAQHVGPLARQAPEAEELAALLGRREEPHHPPRSALQGADAEAREEGDDPEEPLALAVPGADADQDPDDQGGLDGAGRPHPVLDEAEGEGSQRGGELEGDEQVDHLGGGEVQGPLREDAREGDDRGEPHRVDEEHRQEADQLREVAHRVAGRRDADEARADVLHRRARAPGRPLAQEEEGGQGRHQEEQGRRHPDEAHAAEVPHGGAALEQGHHPHHAREAAEVAQD